MVCAPPCADFKFQCTAHLLHFYSDLLTRVVHSRSPKHPITMALDRLTVQLFNAEDATVRCVCEGTD